VTFRGSSSTKGGKAGRKVVVNQRVIDADSLPQKKRKEKLWEKGSKLTSCTGKEASQPSGTLKRKKKPG